MLRNMGAFPNGGFELSTYLNLLQIALKRKFDNDSRNGIHISDLILCPRKSILQKLNPQPLTMKDLNFFTSGRAIHDSIQILAADHHDENNRFEIEKEIKYKDIEGHIDLYDAKENVPIECKSMRVKTANEPKKHHIDQLKSYMAITGSNKGVLLYQLLLNMDGDPWKEFEITTTEKENKLQLIRLETLAKSYKENLEAKTPMKMVGAIDNPDMNWLCRFCVYHRDCQENRTKEESKK